MVHVRLAMSVSVLALAVLSGGFLVGDDKKPDDKEPKAKGTLPQYWKKIGLSDEQLQKVYKVESSYRTKIDALKQQMDDLKHEEKMEMDKILTDAQKVRLKELKLGEKEEPKDKPPVKEDDKDKKPVKDKVEDKKPSADK